MLAFATIMEDQALSCLESASRKSSTSTRSSTGTSLLASTPTEKKVSPHDLEAIANECTIAAYDLVWEQKNYAKALSVLLNALEIQRSVLGKHHKDVGYTCNFIATTYWLQNVDLNSAMRYFLEARRIFCKLMNQQSSINSEDFQTTGPLIQGIDDRIHCILVKFQLPTSDIRRAKQAINRCITHEMHGDRFKAQGLIQASKEEYRRARKVAKVFRQLM